MRLFPRPDPALTIAGFGRDLRAERTSCVEIAKRCLSRIDEREAMIRAWVVVDREGAIHQARLLDEELRAGRDRGPLHGVPVGIKDIIDVQGMPTAAGFVPWADRVAGEDAWVVTRLRDAGAVILGKTVTTQFAWIDPPPTANPWSLDRTPGGSSSGSAAAVADGMCLAALGTQTGGSITRPAAFCGLVGYKPTYQRIPDAGIVPFAPSLDHPGVLARSVEDLALIVPALFSLKRQSSIADETLRPKIGRLTEFFEAHADLVARETIESAVSAFAEAGAFVERVSLPAGFEQVTKQHRMIMAVEAAEFHEQRLEMEPDYFAPRIRELVEEGLAARAVDYVRAKAYQQSATRELAALLAGEFEMLACPAARGVAPDRSTTGDPVLNSPWSLAGLPTVSIPLALSPESLPLSIQLVGRHDGDFELIQAALWCERTLHGDA